MVYSHERMPPQLAAKVPGSTVLLAALALTFGCSSDETDGAAQLERQVTSTLGATCGQWQTSTNDESPRRRLEVTCGSGLTCAGWLDVYPEGQIGNHFGLCLPEGGDQCGAGSTCSEPELTCLEGVDAPPPGRCLFRCSEHQDCPGTFQICSTDGCQFHTCSAPGVTPAVGCVRGAHCEAGLCVPDAAGG